MASKLAHGACVLGASRFSGVCGIERGSSLFGKKRREHYHVLLRVRQLCGKRGDERLALCRLLVGS